VNSNAYAYTVVAHDTGIRVPHFTEQYTPGWGRDLLDPHWQEPFWFVG